MKATIRYTKYDGSGSDGEGIVRVSEITHCISLGSHFSRIMLTTGESITAANSVTELERRIDAAEATEIGESVRSST